MRFTALSRLAPVADRARSLLVGSDPGLVRLRLAARVTLTTILVGLAMLGLHALIGLPPVAFALGLTLAIQNSVAIKDRARRARLRTRLVCAAASLLALALVAPMAGRIVLVDGFFLVVAFVSVYARRWGVRWNAAGMCAFMSCFVGAYFHPAPGELPMIALAIATQALVAAIVREAILPDRPAADFARTFRAVEERIGALVSRLRAGLRRNWPPKLRGEAIAAEARVKSAIAAAEALLPDDDADAGGRDTPASLLAIKLFDLHLATETALATALDGPAGDEASRNRVGASLDRLAKARLDLRRSVEALGPGAFETPPAGAPKATPPALPWHRQPAFRLAVQVTLASALAMAGGLWVSEQRWFWAVLTAFLVFVNTQSRGDAVLRGLDRAIGTAAGIGVGMLIAAALHGAFAASVALILVCVFCAFYLVQVSYGALTFFMTVALALLYGLIGSFSPELLVLRLQETLVGALAGVSVSFFVFPQRTETLSRRGVDAFLGELDRLVETFADHRRGNASSWRVVAVSRALDRRHVDIVATIRPLESGWIAPPRRRLVRLGLLRLAALAYWAHRLASTATLAPAAPAEPRAASGAAPASGPPHAPGATDAGNAPASADAPTLESDALESDALDEAIAACRAEIAALRSGVGHFFRHGGTVALTPPDAMSASRDLDAPDAGLALHALRHILHQALAEADGTRGDAAVRPASR